MLFYLNANEFLFLLQQVKNAVKYTVAFVIICATLLLIG